MCSAVDGGAKRLNLATGGKGTRMLDWKNLLLLLGLLATAAFFFYRSRGDLSVPDARQLVHDGALLVDVRSPEEYAAGHIEGARNIPVDQVAGRIPEFGAPGDPIVLYCRSGYWCGLAQRLLQERGFENVHKFGAMSRW
jgi:rhodanese-related sulfurtransferase